MDRYIGYVTVQYKLGSQTRDKNVIKCLKHVKLGVLEIKMVVNHMLCRTSINRWQSMWAERSASGAASGAGRFWRERERATFQMGLSGFGAGIFLRSVPPLRSLLGPHAACFQQNSVVAAVKPCRTAVRRTDREFPLSRFHSSQMYLYQPHT
jgi:hypothetical protein